MRYFYDCEFLEDGSTIELISLGMVAEDGREFYGVNRFASWDRIARHPWLMENVVPSLPLAPRVQNDGQTVFDRIDGSHPSLMTRGAIARGVLDLIDNDPYPQLWAYYAAYDHVCLCQLWGRMIDLPKRMPMWTHDLMQERERHSNPALPEQAEGHHNALDDARWNRQAFLALNGEAA